MKITDSMLTKACAAERTLFNELFPEGVCFTSEQDAVDQCTAVASKFDWEWAAENLLTETPRIDYEKAANNAWAALAADVEAEEAALAVYHEAKETAWAVYHEVMANARAARNEAVANARAAYDEAKANARAARNEAVANAREAAAAAYDEAVATAFARAFWASSMEVLEGELFLLQMKDRWSPQDYRRRDEIWRLTGRYRSNPTMREE